MRLRPRDGTQVLFKSVCFNSLKVRLRLVGLILVDDSCAMFQFLKGAIKTAKINCVAHLVFGFQFLKGAIKTAALLIDSVANFKFQFLKGAIKTNYLRELNQSKHCFNSLKVRLRLQFDVAVLSSSMVSIP